MALEGVLLDCFWNWREMPDYLNVIFFPLISPCAWVCRRHWLRTWTCSQPRSIIGLQIIDDVKNPAAVIQKSSTIHILRALWLPTQMSHRIKNPTLHKLQVCLFLMGSGCSPERWKSILNSLRKGRILLLQNSIMCWWIKWILEDSASVECLIVWLQAVTPEKQTLLRPCAMTGEKRCLALKRHQMKANALEALGFSSQILESGQCTPGKPSISMSFHRHATKFQSQGTQGSCCIWQMRLVL